jgi:tRNA (Thr-GGU) A37 N-methylase
MKDVIYKPIGIIHSPYKKPSKTPKYPQAVRNIRGAIEIFPEFPDEELAKLFQHAIDLREPYCK